MPRIKRILALAAIIAGLATAAAPAVTGSAAFVYHGHPAHVAAPAFVYHG